MRYVEFEKVVETVESLCIAAAYELPDDVLAALKKAARRESNPSAAKILNQLIENARIAAEEKIPLCQDTGLAVVFVEQGAGVTVKNPSRNKTLVDAINAGVASGYEKGYLRKSVAGDPLNNRFSSHLSRTTNHESRITNHESRTTNHEPRTTNHESRITNTPAIIHHTVVLGDKLKLTIMLKGAGCENKSRFRMFNPTAEKGEIIDWVVDVVKEAGADACPPFVVGVGIGGDFEVCCLLSKKALLRNLSESNADKFYGKIERDLFSRINSLGLGPQGLGGDTTALAVLIEAAPCHIASLPVAVNIECHSHRHKTAII